MIKYPEGRLIFHRPVTSVVESESIVNRQVLAGHRVFIHVDYETFLNSMEETGFGGRARRQIGDHWSIGATYVEDRPDLDTYELAGVDTEVRLGKATRLVAEYANSEGAGAQLNLSNDGGLTYSAGPAINVREGAAWKVAAELDVGEWFDEPERYKVNLYRRVVEPGFSSSDTFADQGTEKLGANASFVIGEADSLQLRHDREERVGSGGAAPNAGLETTISSLQWDHTEERWGVTTELFDLRTEDLQTGARDRSGLAATRLWTRLTEKLGGGIEHQHTLSGTENNQTTVGIDYQALPSLALAVKASDGSRGSSAEAGATWTTGETSLYVTQRLLDGEAGQKRAIVAGTKAPLDRHTQVYSEYQWETSSLGDKTISLTGVRRQWEVGEGLRVMLSGEGANVEGGPTGGRRTALSAGLFYSNARRLQASTRQEIRRQTGSADRVQYFTVNQLEYRVNDSFTLLGRFRYSKTEDRDTDLVDALFEERVVGVAFRPVENNRFNALAKYTLLRDKRPFSGSEPGPESEMGVFSVDTAYQATRRMEWVAKLAARTRTERVTDLPAVDSETYLTVQRLNFNLWKPLDLGVEYRILGQRQLRDRRQGWLGEVSWRVLRQFRVGVGYNFTDFSDNEFSDNDYSVEGLFLRLQGMY